MSKTEGLIFDIQRFAIHDGPGIRTTVFLKGCTNSCTWCHNPESISMNPQIQFFEGRCSLCGNCIEQCNRNCHRFTDSTHIFLSSDCSGCGACVLNCNQNALVLSGRLINIDEVLNEVLKDLPYYKASSGGVTISGGEPVLQSEFCLELLKKLKFSDIHTVLQTAGNYNFDLIEPLLPYIDIIMYDLKAISDWIYKMHIGGDKSLILTNLLSLDKRKVRLILRTPIIGSINDNEEEILLIVKFLKSLTNLEYYKLIPFHSLWHVKQSALGFEVNSSMYVPSLEKMKTLIGLASQYIPQER